MSKSITNLFLIVIILAVYIFVISPLQKGGGTLSGLDKSINELSVSNSELTNSQNQAQELIDQSKKYQSERQLLKDIRIGEEESTEQTLLKMIPKTVDPVRLEEEVVRILGKKGFAVDTISYSQNSQTLNNNYGSYTVNFSTKGDYKRFKELINSFEISKRIYVIKSVSFSSPTILDSKVGADVTMPFQVRLETYYMN